MFIYTHMSHAIHMDHNLSDLHVMWSANFQWFILLMANRREYVIFCITLRICLLSCYVWILCLLPANSISFFFLPPPLELLALYLRSSFSSSLYLLAVPIYLFLFFSQSFRSFLFSLSLLYALSLSRHNSFLSAFSSTPFLN